MPAKSSGRSTAQPKAQPKTHEPENRLVNTPSPETAAQMEAEDMPQTSDGGYLTIPGRSAREMKILLMESDQHARQLLNILEPMKGLQGAAVELRTVLRRVVRHGILKG